MAKAKKRGPRKAPPAPPPAEKVAPAAEAAGMNLQPFGNAVICLKCGNVAQDKFKRTLETKGEIEYLAVTCDKCGAPLGDEMTREMTRNRPVTKHIFTKEEMRARAKMPHHGDTHPKRRRNTDPNGEAELRAHQAEIGKTMATRVAALERKVAERDEEIQAMKDEQENEED